MIDNGANDKDYDNPEANEGFHPPKFKDSTIVPNIVKEIRFILSLAAAPCAILV